MPSPAMGLHPESPSPNLLFSISPSGIIDLALAVPALALPVPWCAPISARPDRQKAKPAPHSPMKPLRLVSTPTRNRRLNEILGLVVMVSAGLLFLALASYTPTDPSADTVGGLVATPHPA